ncbi:hypothetical protein QE152_g1891 [Popillia japonica]|uniref:Uncharacterized protein n=1 Tax=Popillia japonica TaxID=7064 RepID=A0AAW1N522_POPJA
MVRRHTYIYTNIDPKNNYAKTSTREEIFRQVLQIPSENRTLFPVRTCDTEISALLADYIPLNLEDGMSPIDDFEDVIEEGPLNLEDGMSPIDDIEDVIEEARH